MSPARAWRTEWRGERCCAWRLPCGLIVEPPQDRRRTYQIRFGAYFVRCIREGSRPRTRLSHVKLQAALCISTGTSTAQPPEQPCGAALLQRRLAQAPTRVSTHPAAAWRRRIDCMASHNASVATPVAGAGLLQSFTVVAAFGAHGCDCRPRSFDGLSLPAVDNIGEKHREIVGDRCRARPAPRCSRNEHACACITTGGGGLRFIS